MGGAWSFRISSASAVHPRETWDAVGGLRLEQVGLVQGAGVTHLRYRVVR